MSNFTYVYRIRSQSNPGQVYTGITANLESRIKKHNAGSVPHTSKYKPWSLETAHAFVSKDKATAFERYLKTGSGREFARRHF